MDWIFLIVVGLIVFYALNKRSKAKSGGGLLLGETEHEQTHAISEETVFKVQNRFETKLVNEIDFPDAIRGREIFIYRNLMLPWFNKLAAKHRYAEKMTQQLRNDWIDYIQSVQDRSTYSYLSLEFDDEEKTKRYREDHITASRKMFAIEDAFAEAIGEGAPEELKKAHELEYNAVSKNGELAPDGYKWDLGRENLVPVKQK